jgi:hypothetical protein
MLVQRLKYVVVCPWHRILQRVNAWRCLWVLAGEIRSGFFLQRFFRLARRRSTPVVSEVDGWIRYVFSVAAKVVLRVCTVPPCAI